MTQPTDVYEYRVRFRRADHDVHTWTVHTCPPGMDCNCEEEAATTAAEVRAIFGRDDVSAWVERRQIRPSEWERLGVSDA